VCAWVLLWQNTGYYLLLDATFKSWVPSFKKLYYTLLVIWIEINIIALIDLEPDNKHIMELNRMHPSSMPKIKTIDFP
jgi:hypothetical protein